MENRSLSRQISSFPPVFWIANGIEVYMGSNFLAVAIGGFTSGFTYTSLYGRFDARGRPEWVWYVMGAHMAVAVVAFWLFVKLAGEFQEREE